MSLSSFSDIDEILGENRITGYVKFSSDVPQSIGITGRNEIQGSETICSSNLVESPIWLMKHLYGEFTNNYYNNMFTSTYSTESRYFAVDCVNHNKLSQIDIAKDKTADYFSKDLKRNTNAKYINLSGLSSTFYNGCVSLIELFFTIVCKHNFSGMSFEDRNISLSGTLAQEDIFPVGNIFRMAIQSREVGNALLTAIGDRNSLWIKCGCSVDCRIPPEYINNLSDEEQRLIESLKHYAALRRMWLTNYSPHCSLSKMRRM